MHLTGRSRTELDTAVETLGDRAVGIQSDVSNSGETTKRRSKESCPCSPFTSLSSGSRRSA
ncbi:hypothetical protein HEP84_46140 [Streptomyces sp. RLB1-33]|nr:hypothetical protein [Streptomyces sp. RLB1-33]